MMQSALKRPRTWAAFCIVLSAASVFGLWIQPRIGLEFRPVTAFSGGLSNAAFCRLIETLSEQEGYFSSDNFISNETSYLQVSDKLLQSKVSSGAYIGVGPEQNFTYIAKVRPQIAIIVDIRRQAIMQHLLYKALFSMSRSRAEFFSNLLSRPLRGLNAADNKAPIENLLEFFSTAPSSDELFSANLVRVLSFLQKTLGFPLSDRDREELVYVYSTFRREGLDITFQSGRRDRWGGFGHFPSLKELILERDLQGNFGNFMASDEDYRYIRELQLENRIIPVVGDFAGSKALAAVGDYLKKSGYTVRAFYTSNVEQFLFRYGTFGQFAANVRRLPIGPESVIIRGVPMRGTLHPAHIAGHRSTTVLQKITIFLTDFDEGIYTSYWDLVTTHFIP